MTRFLVIAAALTALASCKDKNKSAGLPPAQEWTASTDNLPPAGAAVGGANPHGQVNPHAQANPPGDQPDMPPGHPPIDNPHGGGTDVTKMGLSSPDPNRPINPNNKVTGVIKIHPKAKDKVAAGGAVFIIVKRSVDGAPSGPPLAVDKLEWGKGDLPFEVSEKQAMIAGTELTGEVVVTARYDQDGDALSKQPGDVSGSVRVKIPADKVTLTLDDVLQ
jgi:hypothetical protein